MERGVRLPYPALKVAEIRIPKKQLKTQILEITNRLKSHGIPVERWGLGMAKTIAHLAKEIIEGETVITVENGEILRKVKLTHVDVRHVVNGVGLQLVEDRQEFKGGRKRRRRITGVTEKMKPGEGPISSAKRALLEELGINYKDKIESLGFEEKTRMSPSYPGLITKYSKYKMRVNLPNSAFRPEGYIEKQPDKRTFFIWEEIN